MRRAVPGRAERRHRAERRCAALEEAADSLLAGEIAAVVTGPIHKARMQAVGFEFPGQTEFFAARAGVENFAMCLTGGALTVALVTAHVPLREVPALAARREIVRVGDLLAAVLCDAPRPPAARIAVAGLNPHAGESGALGREEIEIIEPAIALLREHVERAWRTSSDRFRRTPFSIVRWRASSTACSACITIRG